MRDSVAILGVLGVLWAGGCHDGTGGGGEAGEEGGSDASASGSGHGGDATQGSADSTGGDGGSDSGSEGGADSGGESTGGQDVSCDGHAFTSPLSALPEIAAVRGRVRGSGIELEFEPVDGARDYRVYRLPDAAAVSESGGLHVQDAIYRCGGDRAAVDLPMYQNGYLNVDVAVTGDIAGYARSEDDSVLGWVFTTPADDREPVYRLGSPAAEHDGQCYGGRTANTRASRYTTDVDERDSLLDAGWRDDGIVFYTAAAADRTVHFGDLGDTWVFYASDAEVAARGAGESELDVLDAAVDGAVPLHRFWIAPCGGIAHDVLSAGASRFDRDFAEGAQPMWRVDWPQLEPDGVLVIEALDAGCPFQGHLSPRAIAPTGNAQAFVTVQDVQQASPTGEVFVNGQHDPSSDPQPIARAYVCPSIEPTETMDVFEDFSEPLDLEQVDLATYGGWNLYLANERLTASFYSIEPEVYAVDAVMGELWVAYADWASDTNGKFRLTPKQTATLAADTFVHATVEVDLFSTGRRYPQLWISSAAAPVQDHMTEGVTLNLQAFGAWPTGLEMQHCDHRTWDVNDQCPIFPTQHEDFDDAPWPAQPFVADLVASGVRARLDLWASTNRAYAFIDGRPHSCVAFDGLLPAGPATVTYGDTLYHSGVDEPVVGTDFMDFLRDHQLTETRRHVDNFGFSSGVAAPAWDHERLPCATTLP